MSIIISDQVASYFVEYGVSHEMIKILREQRINDDDLQTMDRDDIEHLFKNEYGFSFRDRKRMWNAMQNFQLTNANNEVVCIEQEDETSDIYEIINNEPSNQHLNHHYTSSSSNVSPSGRLHNYTYTNTRQNTFEESNSSNFDDSLIIAKTSSSNYEQIPECHQARKSNEFCFEFPVALPIFSSKVVKALEIYAIESVWQTLIDELAQWILTKKQIGIQKGEFQAIGQTVYKLYPVIAKDGFRPWSYFCKCLTQTVRKERRRRGFTRTRIN